MVEEVDSDPKTRARIARNDGDRFLTLFRSFVEKPDVVIDVGEIVMRLIRVGVQIQRAAKFLDCQFMWKVVGVCPQEEGARDMRVRQVRVERESFLHGHVSFLFPLFLLRFEKAGFGSVLVREFRMGEREVLIYRDGPLKQFDGGLVVRAIPEASMILRAQIIVIRFGIDGARIGEARLL